ncbi:MAG: T9SS type A sorting domain-containing protein [Bacteroidetes bacterium]|nr:T9SS type A sorting domain-containing protein [Bacteroidota bacterium]
MNRTLLFAALLCISLAISAQNIPTVEKSLLETEVKVEYRMPDHTTNPFMNNEVSLVSNKGMLTPLETELGETYYDLQSNSSLNNRFQVWDDGTMAAVWTRGMEAAAFSDRGTAYNYFNGSEWGPWPTVRLEDRRCGWPNIAAWGETGEIAVAHNGLEGLEWMQREVKGTGAWTQTNFLGPAGIENDITWPRMITSGENNEYIHLFVNSYVEYMGQASALLYSRSDDGGLTWDPHNIILDGMGEDYYTDIGADNYILAAQGSTVVLLTGEQWYDLFMMKTDDNGETWEKTVIWEHPYPFWNWDVTIADTFFCVCRASNIALDNTNKAHVVFAINRVAHFEVGGTYNLWPYYDGIGYWNEDMDAFSDDLNALAPPQYGYANSEMIEDVNYIGWMQDVDGDGQVTLNTELMYYQQHGPSTVPSIGINEFGNIYVIYSSTTETYENDVYNYKHLWIRSCENGMWGDFLDLSADITHIFDECYYPVIGKVTNSAVHYIYNADISPGLAWSDDHAWQQNRIIYGMLDVLPGIGENGNETGNISVEIHPNPASMLANIKVNLKTQAEIIVLLTNMTGQVVKEVKRGVLNHGSTNIGIDVSGLPAGTYICTVKADDEFVTQKLIVR